MKTPEEIKRENKALIESLMIDELLIDPIKKIIIGLKNHEFGNNDIDFIEAQLEKFTNLALELIGLNFKTKHERFIQLNDYTTSKYIEYFTVFLNLFKKATES